jgi:FKBP-type peptidyl-prolyl cis-trans isomerase
MCLDFAVSMLKVGGEALIMANAMYAYGESGLPGKVDPNEAVLIYVKLLSAKKGGISKEVPL